ncbi:MAG: apolipoprotein N-acyltransferase [Deltaproteobacteria bacterium]|nr:apolipoprotein N-acyltransferase [Deltaproteobacteria bacterium]
MLLAAGLYALALPPWSMLPVAAVALVPFLLALRDVAPLRAGWLGLLFGTAAIWGVGHWVPGALAYYYQQPLWFGVGFALAASVVFAGSYGAGFAACAAWIGSRTAGAARVLALAALWVAWELARARLLTGDPWLLFGYALGPSPALRQAADLGGVYLLSFVAVLANAAIAEALAGGGRGRFAGLGAALGVLLAAWAYGAGRLATALPGAAVPLVVVQGNNPVGAQWTDEDYGAGLERYVALSRAAAAAARPSLLVWPESALTVFLAEDRGYRATIGRMLRETGAELVVGGPFRDGEGGAARYFNAAFHVTADGRIAGRYDKTHLLPFAEYFPLRTIQFLRRRFERVRYFTAGERQEPIVTSFGPVAIVICFEAIFPEIVRARMAHGARLLLNLSNDAWLGTGAGREQHLAMVALRAVENRTWVVRATTTGVSALIDPFGRVVARADTDAATTLAGGIVPLAVETVYERAGDAFAYACVAFAIVGAVACAIGRPPPRV